MGLSGVKGHDKLHPTQACHSLEAILSGVEMGLPLSSGQVQGLP